MKKLFVFFLSIFLIVIIFYISVTLIINIKGKDILLKTVDKQFNVSANVKKVALSFPLNIEIKEFSCVDVSFGIEADLLNAKGDICDQIEDIKSDFLVLSAHSHIFKGNPQDITVAYLKAIERHGDRISVLGHPYAKYFDQELDIARVTAAANEAGIPLEVNGQCLLRGFANYDLLDQMLSLADRIVVNSDAHNIHQFLNGRTKAFEYLKSKNIKIVSGD